MKTAEKKFTLLELLIVIAIIAILVTMLLPALNSARMKATDITCTSKQKQIGFALNSYADDFNGYLPKHKDWAAGPYIYWKWQDKILHYLRPGTTCRWNNDYLMYKEFNCPAQPLKPNASTSKHYGMNGFITGVQTSTGAFFKRIKKPHQRMVITDIDRTGDDPSAASRTDISPTNFMQRHVQQRGVVLLYGDLHVGSIKITSISTITTSYFWGQ